MICPGGSNLLVLCYHRISRTVLPSGTWVGPAQLAAQLDALAEAGARFITPEDLHAQLLLDGSPVSATDSRPPILLTFDDGTDDLFEHRGILNQRGLKPLVFAPADHVGRVNTWEWSIPGRRAAHLTADQLLKLQDDGWEIGLHGASHCDLVGAGSDRLEREVDEGKARLQRLLGRSVRYFSYPYGRADRIARKQVEDAGFSAAFVLAEPARGDSSADRFQLARRPVYCIDGAKAVVTKWQDPGGCTSLGRWQLWQERAAHGVGRWTAALMPRSRSESVIPPDSSDSSS